MMSLKDYWKDVIEVKWVGLGTCNTREVHYSKGSYEREMALAYVTPGKYTAGSEVTNMK